MKTKILTIKNEYKDEILKIINFEKPTNGVMIYCLMI